MRGGNLVSLDVVRGGAALYVAAYHAVGSLTPSGLRFDSRGGSVGLLLDGNPLGILGFGLYPVLAFFVLSGFVIHLRQARRPDEVDRRGKLGWAADYGWRRAMRIYPPLVAAMVLTALLAAAGSRHFPERPLASGSLTEARNVLLPVYGPASFGNDFPLWSITYELWFYVLYVPIALGLLRLASRIRMGSVLAGALGLAFALVVARDHAPQLLPTGAWELSTFLVYFPAWVAGAFLAELYATGAPLRHRRWVAAAAAGIAVVAAFHSGNDLRPAVDLLWGVAVCLVIAVLTLRPEADQGPSRPARWVASTASWSYSLYLVHLPVILFGQAALGHGVRRITNPLVVLALFLATLAAAWLFSRAVERPSLALMRRRGRAVRSPAPPSGSAGPGPGQRRP